MHIPQLSLPLWLRHAALLGAGTLALVGCNPDDDKPEPTPEVKTNSVFVVNEGSFGTPNGSVSLFDVETKRVSAVDIYQAANNQPLLADVAQSMTIANGRGYIVANNNSKLEIVTLPDFKRAATISTPLAQPRYVAVASADKAYVSEWVRPTFPTPVVGRVAVIDLRTNTVTRTIAVGKAPEEMLLANGKLFVANSEDNTVTVINTSTDAVETTLTVGPHPSSLVQDRDGRIWVLSTGSTDYANPANSVKGSLTDFAATAPYTVRKRDFTFTPGYSARLRRNNTGEQLYVLGNNAIYRIGTGDATLPTTALLRRSNFYGLDVDPNDGTLYVGVALSYSGPGRIVRYQPNGTALDSATVGILPNGFAFYTK
jgi:YVTN family beta-propeller protein